MIKALQTAASGMTVQQLSVDNIAHNLANANTTGFKRSHIDFQDLLYQNLGRPARQSEEATENSPGIEIGSGARVAAASKIFTQGTIEETTRSLDVAIEGDGFFEVTLNENESAYTRDGSFKLDSQRQLTMAGGQLVQPAIVIPEEASTISIAQDGTVAVQLPGETEPQTIGQITLVRFPNNTGLSSVGNNLYKETLASGTPVPLTPGTEGMGVLRQGFLERSNVEVVAEMVRLIIAQRAYEINTKAIRTGDEMLSMANNLMR